MDTQPQVVVVSGGSRGLGRELVADFLAGGYAVATYSRSAGPFIELTQAAYSEDRFYWQCIEAADLAQVGQFAADVIRRYGCIDVLINSVAEGADGLLSLMPDAAIHRAVALNLESTLFLTRACLKSMLDRRGGCIVNVSSVNAIRGHAGLTVYSASKAALDGLTRSLAREVGSVGIRVNSVAPGYFGSDMTAGLSDEQRAAIVRRTPLKRLADVTEIVSAIRFLCSPDASFITGQTIVVDGGLTC